MSDDETSVRYGAAGSYFAAQCLEKRRILTSALSKINGLSATDMIPGNKILMGRWLLKAHPV